MPSAKTMGIRVRRDSSGAKEGGRVAGGLATGRKPRWVETVKGMVEGEIGESALRMGKENSIGEWLDTWLR